MTKKLKIVLAQLNLIVGAIEANIQKMLRAAEIARDAHAADIIVFPELAITGYLAEDLYLRKSFLTNEHLALEMFIKEIKGIHCIIGHTHQTSAGLQNSCSIIYNGTILGRYSKQHLPNYSVFDECRYFTTGNSPCVIPINGIPIAPIICEDTWYPGAIKQAANQGARLILSLNASPFEIDKHEQRHLMLAKRAKEVNLPIAYVNMMGGQDDLIFDGGSMIVDDHGNIAAHAGFFNETLLPVEVNVTSTETNISPTPFTLTSTEERIYTCLVQGVKDYIHKNGFTGVLIGVSGGIDSALTLAIAVDALGKEHVHTVMLPSRYTSHDSMEDGQTLIKNFGVTCDIISIEPTFEILSKEIQTVSKEKLSSITEQNLQSRCRGIIMMALSNQTGKIVLTTGNRSELAVGYCTLYGDMVGGYNPLKDVPKTLVYRLANYRNNLENLIPQRILIKPPTAELAHNQKDSDSLPEYDVLDRIIELYINQALSIEEIVVQGYERDVVTRVATLIHQAEYKRRQAPIGARISHKAFSRDRRYPITSYYKK